MNIEALRVGSVSLPRRAFSALARPVDALPIDLFRVAAGVLVLVYFIRTLAETGDFSGPDGLLDHRLILEMYWFTGIGIFRDWMGTDWFYAAYALAIAFSVPLIVGYRPRLFAAILYVIAVSAYRRNFIVMYVDDSIIHLLLFWMMVMPVGRTLALGDWLRERRSAWERWKRTTVPGTTLRLFIINLSLLYVVAGLWKWTSPMWLDGTAIYVVFKLPISFFHEFWSVGHIPFLSFLDYATLVLEPVVPLMFALRRGHRLKYLMLAAFLGLHLGTAATLNIPFANVACAAVPILMFREELMAWLRGTNSLNEPKRWSARLGIGDAASVFMVAMLTLAMISSIPLSDWRIAPREVQARENAPGRVEAEDRAEGLESAQMTFFGALWLMGIAQQYQLFNWIDDRNYIARYRVTVGGREADPDAMFVRSLRGVLLDFYIHDVTWFRIPPERRQDLRTSILTRAAARYCRNQRPSGEVEVSSSLERINPAGGRGKIEEQQLMRFTCREDAVPVFAAAP